jgi:hypothetical protein
LASDRITIRIPKILGKQLHGRSRESGKTPSTIVRVALEAYLNAGGSSASAFDMAAAAGLIGCASDLSKDLSTNRRHMEGFGKRK